MGFYRDLTTNVNTQFVDDDDPVAAVRRALYEDMVRVVFGALAVLTPPGNPPHRMKRVRKTTARHPVPSRLWARWLGR